MPQAWRKAAELAALTPPGRNRAADFLRAASISVVVLGHWLMAGPWVDQDGSHLTHLLTVSPWTHWLTWIFQVMPVFFFVGGYANAISWQAARRDGKTYAVWLRGRLGRLCVPVIPLILFWAIAAAAAGAAGVPEEMIRLGSITALLPTWFLAVYFVVVALVPLADAAWRRFGMASFWWPAAGAAALDALYFGADLRAPAWANYLLIWGAVHQLGFAWQAGRAGAGAGAARWCALGLVFLTAMTSFGPWPRSLVGVPGEAVSNTTPPHLPLLALCAFQFGAVLLMAPRLRRWLDLPGPWTATILLNGSIMTLFLWHSTAMMLSMGLAILLGGIGLHELPGTAAWWLLRPAWIAVYAAVLALLLTIFGRLERPARRERPAPPAWLLILSLLLAAAGLSALALGGVRGAGAAGIRLIPLALALAGLLGAGWLPGRAAPHSGASR